MKKHNVFLMIVISTTISLPILSMEKLNQPTFTDSEIVSDVVIPNGKRLRARLMQKIAAAIDGNIDKAPDLDPDQIAMPELLSASPQSLIKQLRSGFQDQRDEYLQENFAITKEMVQGNIPAAATFLAANKENIDQYSPATTPVKKAVKQVVSKFQGPDLNVRKIKAGTEAHLRNMGSIAYVNGDNTMVYIDEELEHVAPTPKSKEQVFAHEDTHRRHGDVLTNVAIELTFRDLGTEYSPGTRGRVTRFQEVFADLEPASISPASAAASLRVAQRMEALSDRKDMPGEHHAPVQRTELAAVMKDLHKEHQQERARKRKDEPALAPSKLKQRRLLDAFDEPA